MKISAALIVKNEEACLARCLNSIVGAVDEIVVVDTGSEDETRAVARCYTDRIFDYPWRNDFASARNYSFAQVTGDWVFWVDADDVVIGSEKIRPMLQRADPELACFYWRYISSFDEWGNPTGEFWRERTVRNDGTFKWQGRIHEVLLPERACETRRTEEVVVHHRSDPSRIPSKLRRNIEILEAEYEAEVEPSPRTLFYMASEYASTGDLRKALEFFRRYLKVAVWDDERYVVQTRMADIYRSIGNYRQAIDAGLRALKICPHWPDAYFGLAESYYYLRDWHKVIHWTEVGRAMPIPDTTHIINPMKYIYNWIIFYTNALFQVGEIREALKWTERALEVCPRGPWHTENLFLFTEALGGSCALEAARKLALVAAGDPAAFSASQRTESYEQTA